MSRHRRHAAAAGRSQKGLGFPIDYLELEPQALANLGEKLRAVLGGSARLGRDQAGARDPSRAHLVPADPQRVEGAAGQASAIRAKGHAFAPHRTDLKREQLLVGLCIPHFQRLVI